MFIHITYNIRIIDFIFIVIILMFRPIYPSAFYRCFMLNSGANTEPKTKPFIEITAVDYSNSVNHDC